MSEKNQDKCPAESAPPPYDYTVPQGQQYEQLLYPQGYSKTNEYAQIHPPQGCSHGTGYQPLVQGFEQQGYPETQYYGQQPMYGGQGQNVVSFKKIMKSKQD
ncbi:uncharacterized protein LOC134684557 [Mytilus trossulus]|uniref:uncharacterized protein LOC134684557 n=1 Tax=Mytilus trossulus TaxID=6551 RepID=UPI0030068C08